MAAMLPVKLTSAGKKPLSGLPPSISVPENATVADLKTTIAALKPKLYTSRQKLTLKGEKKALKDSDKLADVGVFTAGELVIKDLGPQISWRTVFFVEYIGPLLIHPAIYYLPRLFYGGLVQHSFLQERVFILCMIHFLKREFEAIFVHRFSNGTMPLSNIFRNSAHYWLLSGLGMAWANYSPRYAANSPHVRGLQGDVGFINICSAVWAWAEVSNLVSHLQLRALRPAGTKTRGIPYGYGFSLVSCPNYTFETIAWVSIAVMTGSWASWVFVAVSVYIMTIWALKKHKAYKREFGDKYPKGRKVIFPFIY